MHMKLKLFPVVFICVLISFLSCEKEPKKGEYKGTFQGGFVADSGSVTYTTTHYFEVTRSTKDELRLKEKESQVTSILKKHEKDSISGMIGFGSIYSPVESGSIAFNTVSIRGKYDKGSISGKFSTSFTDGNKDYLSEGDFMISAY